MYGPLRGDKMPEKMPAKEKGKKAKIVTELVTAAPKVKKHIRFRDVEVRTCTCQHDFQDTAHGRGRRVFNPCKKGQALRCTVCHREVTD